MYVCMYPEWGASPVQDSPVWVNSPLATVIERHQKKCIKDSLKKTLGTCPIDHHQWSTLAADRQAWRHTVHQDVSTFEDSRRANLRQKRRRRKIQGALAAIPDQIFNCSRCGRICQSRIDLVSHRHIFS